ncbi:MAG: hypothetical protein M9887_11400 [Chitinophagales bacterium]|nr:hypothetical protein [Chitinophagales bacterium]
MQASLKILAKVISILLHPILMPFYGTLIFLWANPSIEPLPNPNEGITRTLSDLRISIFINTFLMPFIGIAMLKAVGFIKSFEMEDKQERIIPFIITMTLYIWTFLAVNEGFFYMPKIYPTFILGVLISLFAGFIINLFLKLSIHMMGISGLMIGLMFMILFGSERSLVLFFILSIIANILVAASRLYLKAHTMKEIYTGLMIGIGGQMIAVTFFSKFMGN